MDFIFLAMMKKAVIVILFVLISNLTCAQLNQFKDDKKKLDSMRLPYFNNKIKEKRTYSFRIKNGIVVNDSTLISTTRYDAMGNEITDEYYGVDDKLKITDVYNYDIKYDAQNHKVWQNWTMNKVRPMTTIYQYNTDGLLINYWTTTGPDDKKMQSVTRFGYNEKGNVVIYQKPYYTNSQTHKYAYNDKDEVTTHWTYSIYFPDSIENKEVFSYEYSNTGIKQLKQVFDKKNNLISKNETTYNLAGNKLVEYDLKDNKKYLVSAYRFDSNGKMTERLDPLINYKPFQAPEPSGYQLHYFYKYDNDGNLTSVTVYKRDVVGNDVLQSVNRSYFTKY